tara:strand:+ start:685 stop:1902 length:1218 start_codon:yes stop_codon:yes gene_type:complete
MYTRNELDAMAHGRVKKLAIAKAKQTGAKSSWIQTTSKSDLIDYIVSGRTPEEYKQPKPVPEATPKTVPTTEAKPQASTGSLEDMLADKVAEKLGDGIFTRVEGIENGLIDTFTEQTEKLSKKVDKKIQSLQRPVTVYIDDVEVKNVSGLKHKQFPFVLECLKIFKRVWLCGPSGTGKSHLIEQCAKALGFDTDQGNYEYLKGSAGVTESHMTGRMTFDGTFIDGSVSRAFRDGNFLCLDEFDGFDANAGLVFNSVLDNQGILATPNDKDNPFVTKHNNFHVAVASNTWGDGNDFDFAGRGQLDLATLDRLQAVKVYVNYDRNIERALVGEHENSTALADCLWSLRNRCDKQHVRRTISTRLFLDGQKWMLARKSIGQFLDIITTGWTKEEKDKVSISELKREYK